MKLLSYIKITQTQGYQYILQNEKIIWKIHKHIRAKQTFQTEWIFL